MTFAAAGRFARRRFAGWTLRGRLLAALIALLALMCLIVGIVTETVAHKYLVAELDSSVSRLSQHAQHNAPDTNPPPGPPGYLNQGQESVGVVVRNGQIVQSGGYSESYDKILTTPAQNTVLAAVPMDRHEHTVTLPGLGDYRVMAAPAPYDTKLVTGLPLKDVNSALIHLDITEICVAIAGLIAVGLVGESIIRRTLRPLRRVAAIATRVSEMELDRGEVALSVRVPARDTDPRTEVGQVGASLNRMLGHVSAALTARQASEVRVRKFVADASHELRTPLAAIRGYAELTRRVSDGALPDDVAYAMRRVESESARMTTLVEDLLLLARLDAGRPLDHSPVDLSRLVVDVVSDAHVAGGEHEWNLDLPEDQVSVLGDEPRLHQVIANLLANARAHTPAGTKVTLALTAVPDGGARITVVDNGPGISKVLLPDVFERFARGDSSRSRAAGSTGLGLAIVAAVVEAHGGTVAVASRPGETAFTVTLPGAPPSTLSASDRHGTDADAGLDEDDSTTVLVDDVVGASRISPEREAMVLLSPPKAASR
jgi:two-component system OmpR family sensor kinase